VKGGPGAKGAEGKGSEAREGAGEVATERMRDPRQQPTDAEKLDSVGGCGGVSGSRRDEAKGERPAATDVGVSLTGSGVAVPNPLKRKRLG
jgi:hypothetical protein